MANPTTNYGFVLPTSSDLVTDLPADFDIALQGVDTQLKALNPETTLGDISYRSATANTKTRLAIGTTGQVLTVSGGVPTWATASASGGPAFGAARTTTQSISSMTATKIQFNTENFDTDNCYDPTTNFRFTPNRAGYYQVNLQAYFTGSLSRGIVYIFKNGVEVARVVDINITTDTCLGGTSLIYMNGTSDYLEGYVFLIGSSLGLQGGINSVNLFSATWIRS